jgi:hypothetical protein
MNPILLQAIITQFVAPEILAIIKKHHETTGTLPTDAEVIAQLNTDADALIARGQEFLDASASQS